MPGDTEVDLTSFAALTTQVDAPAMSDMLNHAITTGPVSLPDGSALAADASAGAFVYRVTDKGEQIWNEQANGWQTSPPETELGVSLPVSALCEAIEAGLIGQGHADDDMSAVARSIRALSGLES